MAKLNPESIRARLRSWYLESRRSLPWRESRDPYRIWVSEIMLQQTRVAAVLPYYERFLSAFPDVAALARASDTELLARWNGLGYYARARNLRAAAQNIVTAGEFPRSYEDILQLPGVGEYTAAAIASIAFGLPHAVLDGNVARVMARLLDEHGDIASSKVKSRLRAEAQELLDPGDPGLFNQALMELGATVCLPKEPRCGACPLHRECAARGRGAERELPIKLRRTTPVVIERTLLLIERKKKILMWRRPEGKRMAGFWELPDSEKLPTAQTGAEVGSFRHAVMNRNYRFTVARAAICAVPLGFEWVEPAAALLSTTTRKALKLLSEPRQPRCGTSAERGR